MITLTPAGNICAIVTSCKGSWKYQDAYRLARYLPRQTRDGRTVLASQGRSEKFARTRKTAAKFAQYGLVGSLHNVEVRGLVDNYGNMVWVRV